MARNPGGSGGGRAAVSFSSALGSGPWPPALSPTLSGAYPLGIHGSRGSRGRQGALRSAAGGSVRGGGGRGVLAMACPPRLPQGGDQGEPPRLRISGRHRAVAAHGVGAEPPASSELCGSERAADRGGLTRGCVRRGCCVSPLGAAAPRGVRGCHLSGRPPAAHGLGGGERGGWRGEGFPAVPPPAPWHRPPTATGGRYGGSGPWRPAADRGGCTLPSPPLGPWVPGPRAGPRPGSLLSPPSSRGVGWPGGGGRCVLGAVVRVSGQRLAGCGAVGLLSRSVPASSLPLEVARAPPPHCTGGGGCESGGSGLDGGGVPRHRPLSPPRAHRLGRWGAAVTAIIACAGAGAAALAGSGGGSASR